MLKKIRFLETVNSLLWSYEMHWSDTSCRRREVIILAVSKWREKWDTVGRLTRNRFEDRPTVWEATRRLNLTNHTTNNG
jgi:hypothetical protein